MRVVGGSARGRKLCAVPGTSTRPILDRVKTALFDILRPELAGVSFLDLFAGSGSVGIEALSQGAAFAMFLDIERPAIDTIKKNLEDCKLSAQAEVRHTDAFRFLRHCSQSFDIIYVAPPQYKNIWVEMLLCIAERPSLLNPGGRIIAQIDPSEYEQLHLNALREEQQRKYGSTMLVFYRN